MFYSFFSSPLPCKSVAPEVEMVEGSLLAPGKGTFRTKGLSYLILRKVPLIFNFKLHRKKKNFDSIICM